MENDNSKIINLQSKVILDAIEKETGLNPENSNVVKAVKEAYERAGMYDMCDQINEKKLQEIGIEPRICYNEACEMCTNLKCGSEVHRPVGCLYRMITSPPNSLDYEGYMPSHKEAIEMLEAKGLLVGERQSYIEASSNYGKARSQEERWAHEVKGIDFNILEKCVEFAIKEYFDFIKKEYKVDLEEHADISVIAGNACIETEKAMGIYPNIQLL